MNMESCADMEGYDCDFATPPEPRYECPICLLVLREPHQTKCGHRFCRNCIMKSLRDSSNRCPIDNESLAETDVYPDNFAKREILNFSIKCSNCKTGCDKIFPLGKLQNHLEECCFALVPCPLKCTCDIQRCDLDNHLTSSCENRMVTCEYCCKKMQAKMTQDHLGVCPMVIVVCPHCEERKIRHRMEHHIYNKCQQVKIHCPFYPLGCSKIMVRCKVDEHLMISGSSHLKQLCSAVTFLTQKLGTSDSICQPSAETLLQNVSLVQRVNLESTLATPDAHKSGKCSDNVSTDGRHFNFEAAMTELSSAAKQLPLGGLHNGHDSYNQPVCQSHDWLDDRAAAEPERQSLSLSSQPQKTEPTVCKQFPQISAPVNRSSETYNLLLRDPGMMEDYIPENADVMGMLQEMTSRFKKREVALQQRFEDLHRRFTAIEQANSGLIKSVRDLEQQVVEASGKFVGGDFCWSINNFSHYLLKLEAGESSMLHSPPFYTSPWGYKMCVRASVDLCSQNEKQLSLFVHFMKGKNDAYLMWPFSGRINISVVDQNPDASRRSHIEETLEANPNLDAFQRPIAPRNHKGFGYVHFVSISALENGTFLMNDTLVIRTQVYSNHQ